MNEYRDFAQKKLQQWFQKATDWQKDMFYGIWNGATDETVLVERAIKLIDQEYLSKNNQPVPNVVFPQDIDFSEAKALPIMLKSISNVQGVGALSAKSPLEFDNGLTVVYGENGCGKSSYVRILKAAESPEYSSEVVGNVFSNKKSTASATITFSSDGDEQQLHWDKSNKDKYPLLIYDTDIAHQFVDTNNEVIYEPKVLSIISLTANVFTQVSTHYQITYDESLKKYTQIPEELKNHSMIQAFNKITTTNDIIELEKNIMWNNSLDIELSLIENGLQINEPEKIAQSLEAQKKVVEAQLSNILSMLSLINNQGCEDYLHKRQQQIRTVYIKIKV